MARDGKDGESPGDYEVGYGRPPKEHRFQPGESGNPGGRPRKVEPQPSTAKPADLTRLILQEGKRSVPIREGGVADQLDTATAIVRAMAIAAIKGGPMAQKNFLELTQKSELAERERRDRNQRLVSHYRQQYPQLVRYPSIRLSGTPYCWPHSDDVVFDHDSGEVEFIGPFTKAAETGMSFELSQRDQLLLAVEDCYDIDCGPELQRSIRDYADGLFNAAVCLNAGLSARLRRQMALSSNRNWSLPRNTHCNMILFGILAPLSPGFQRALDADPDSRDYFAAALWRFQGYQTPYLNRSRHYQPAAGVLCTSAQRIQLSSVFAKPRSKAATRATLMAIGRRVIVPPHVIANACTAAARLSAGAPLASTIAEFVASLDDTGMPMPRSSIAA